MFLADYDATIISWKSLPLSGWDLQCMIEGTNQPVRVVSARNKEFVEGFKLRLLLGCVWRIEPLYVRQLGLVCI